MKYKIIAFSKIAHGTCFAAAINWLLHLDWSDGQVNTFQSSYIAGFMSGASHLPARYAAQWGVQEHVTPLKAFDSSDARTSFFCSLAVDSQAQPQFLIGLKLNTMTHCVGMRKMGSQWQWYDTVSGEIFIDNANFLEALAKIEQETNQRIHRFELIWYSKA